MSNHSRKNEHEVRTHGHELRQLDQNKIASPFLSRQMRLARDLRPKTNIWRRRLLSDLEWIVVIGAFGLCILVSAIWTLLDVGV